MMNIEHDILFKEQTLQDIMREVDMTTTLIRKVLVFKSPLTGTLNYRVAYFKENYEANIWESEMDETYTALEYVHSIFTNTVCMTDPASVLIMR